MRLKRVVSVVLCLRGGMSFKRVIVFRWWRRLGRRGSCKMIKYINGIGEYLDGVFIEIEVKLCCILFLWL